MGGDRVAFVHRLRAAEKRRQVLAAELDGVGQVLRAAARAAWAAVERQARQQLDQEEMASPQGFEPWFQP